MGEFEGLNVGCEGFGASHRMEVGGCGAVCCVLRFSISAVWGVGSVG